MELTHLKYFIAVAEELHFGRAAAKLHIAQPPLSQQIKRLEDELEVKLFNRTSRRVELTAAGRVFLEEAHAIVSRAERACAEISDIARGRTGYLAIGFNEPAINTFLAVTVNKFMSSYPEVKLALKELETLLQFEALEDKRIHIGFMRPFGHDMTGYSSRMVISEEYRLAMLASHPLAQQQIIPLKALAGEPLIMFPKATQPILRQRLEDCFRAVGVEPQVVQDATSKHTTLALVKAGIGIALIPESSTLYAPDEVVFRQLSGELPRVNTFAVWRSDNDSPVVENFLRMVPPLNH